MAAAALDLHSVQALRMGCEPPLSSTQKQVGAAAASGHRGWQNGPSGHGNGRMVEWWQKGRMTE